MTGQRYLPLAIAGALLAQALPAALVATDHTPTSLGQEAAERAYQELAAKDYTLAIQDFQKALAADPSNSQWRTDLGYTQVAAGSPRDARLEFEIVYREHPQDLGIALELGYLSQQMHEESAAEDYFKAAAASTDATIAQQAQAALTKLQASQEQERKQRAYDLLAQGRRAEALKLFERVHEADPSDAPTNLQMGYLYDTLGDLPKAREMFEAERGNQNPQVAAQATSALAEINRQSKWWWGNVYAAPFYQSRFSNEVNPVSAKIGLQTSPYLQPYIGLRIARDIRSVSGDLPVIFSDNAAVFALGLQSSILGHGTNLYAEAGTAISLMSQPTQGRAVPDYRVGFTWFQPWGVGLTQASEISPHRFSLTGSGYGDVGFYSRYDHNVIGYLQLREGVNLPTAHTFPVQVLAALNLVKDSNRDFYNNVVEVGPTVRFAPFRRLTTLYFEAQYLHGFYTVHDPTNPYGPRYGEFLFFLVWSKYF